MSRTRPAVAKLGRGFARSDRCSASRPKLAQNPPNVRRFRPNLGRRRPNSGQTRPPSVDLGPEWPKLADFGQICAGQCWPDLPNLGHSGRRDENYLGTLMEQRRLRKFQQAGARAPAGSQIRPVGAATGGRMPRRGSGLGGSRYLGRGARAKLGPRRKKPRIVRLFQSPSAIGLEAAPMRAPRSTLLKNRPGKPALAAYAFKRCQQLGWYDVGP